MNPSTFPTISVDQGVLDWNHEISGAGAQQIVLTLAENLELETQAEVDKLALCLLGRWPVPADDFGRLVDRIFCHWMPRPEIQLRLAATSTRSEGG